MPYVDLAITKHGSTDLMSDIDNGILYMRVEIDGRAMLVGISVCATCYVIVPAASIDAHYEWHRETETSALDIAVKQFGDDHG